MTPNQAKIVITNPCSENWDTMQADDIGRFCQSCQKSVIDFTTQSDEEIKVFLKAKQGQQLCGRFYNHQLHRIRIEIDQNILISNIPFWQKFLVVLLVCFGSDLIGADFAFAQTEPDSIPVKTEQIDSLVPLAITEPDSTMEVHTDSVIRPKSHYKEPNWVTLKWSGGITMGIFYNPGNYFHPSAPELFPKLKIDFVDGEPAEEIPADILVEKSKPEIPSYEFVLALKQLPILPKHPKKRPLRLPENAIIADLDDRRKTRRS